MDGVDFDVALTTYRRPDMAVAAIASCLSQGTRLRRVVVVDDASRDTTEERIRALRDPEVLLHVRAENGGIGAARRDAMARCDAEWTVTLDSDPWISSPGRSRSSPRESNERHRASGSSALATAGIPEESLPASSRKVSSTTRVGSPGPPFRGASEATTCAACPVESGKPFNGHRIAPGWRTRCSSWTRRGLPTRLPPRLPGAPEIGWRRGEHARDGVSAPREARAGRRGGPRGVRGNPRSSRRCLAGVRAIARWRRAQDGSGLRRPAGATDSRREVGGRGIAPGGTEGGLPRAHPRVRRREGGVRVGLPPELDTRRRDAGLAVPSSDTVRRELPPRRFARRQRSFPSSSGPRDSARSSARSRDRGHPLALQQLDRVPPAVCSKVGLCSTIMNGDASPRAPPRRSGAGLCTRIPRRRASSRPRRAPPARR